MKGGRPRGLFHLLLSMVTRAPGRDFHESVGSPPLFAGSGFFPPC